MFKKPKRNFRSRKEDSGSEDENSKRENTGGVEVPNSGPKNDNPVEKKKLKKKKKNKDSEGKLPKSSSAASVLSFEEEVEGEVFKIRKSSHSRRIARQLKKDHMREKEEEEKMKVSEPTRPDYSSDGLKQLRVEQDVHNGVAPVDMELGSDVETNGSTNAPNDDDDKRTNHSSEVSRDTLLDDIDDGDAESQGSLSKSCMQDLLASGQIPDASLIHLARKRRQRARERGEEFIPIDDTVRTEKTASRLIREDDNDHSESDEEERTSFTVNQRDQDLRKMQSMILEAEQGSHSEGSDQERQWEEQQIRKGVQAGSAAVPYTEDPNHYASFYVGQTPTAAMRVGQAAFTAPTGRDSPGVHIRASRSAPPTNLPPVTMDQITRRLTERLSEMTMVHRAHTHERDDIDSRLESCQSDIANQNDVRGSLEERYKFFQEMRGYVRDLVECLSEKMGSITYLERCMTHLLKTRAEKLVKRRQEDIKDQSMDYMGGKVPTSIDMSDVNKQRRVAEREARRARRKRKRQAFGVGVHHDGMSTDDEENNSELIKYTTERDRVTGDVRTMFDDVVDDFAQIDSVKRRFEAWKTKEGDTYSEAYIGMCLPKMFTPMVQLQLVPWNPFDDRSRDFEEMPWFEALMFYGYRDGEDPQRDPDLKLIPGLVDKVLLPKITGLAESVWDPMSTQQTKRLVSLVSHLFANYPTMYPQSKNTQSLIKAIVDRMKKTLDDDVFMPLYPKQVLENKTSGPAIFFHRQFWSHVKLLGNILLWHGSLSNRALVGLALSGLLNRYLVLALHNSAINMDSVAKCQAIVTVFPKAWFSGLHADSTIPDLEQLCRYLVHAANTMDAVAMAPGVKDMEKKEARECIKQIRKLLVLIHAMDHATGLADLRCLKTT